jgi:hypothetical protein
MICMIGNRGLKRLTRVEADLTSWYNSSRTSGSIEHNVDNAITGGQRVPGAPLLVTGSGSFTGAYYAPHMGNSYVNLAGCNARWNNRAKYRLGCVHVYQIYAIRLYKAGTLAVTLNPNLITGLGNTYAGIDFDASDYTGSSAGVGGSSTYPKAAVAL